MFTFSFVYFVHTHKDSMCDEFLNASAAMCVKVGLLLRFL